MSRWWPRKRVHSVNNITSSSAASAASAAATNRQQYQRQHLSEMMRPRRTSSQQQQQHTMSHEQSTEMELKLTAVGDDCVSITAESEDYVPAKLQIEGHDHPVNALSFAPNGYLVVSGSADHTAKLWDLSSGNCLKTLSAHKDAITSVDFSSDAARVATGSTDGTARIWDADSGECLLTIKGSGGAIMAVAISPDAAQVVTGSKTGLASVWSARTGALDATLQGYEEVVLAVDFSPNGAFIATSSEDKLVRIWDRSSCACLDVLKGHAGSVNAVVFCPRGQYIISGSKDETIKVWSLATGVCLRTLKGHVDDIYDISITNDGKYVISASNDDCVRVWSVHTGACLQVLRGHTDCVLSVAVSPSGRHIVSAGGTELHRKDCSIRVWSLAPGPRQRVLTGHNASVKAVAVSQRSNTIASASNDGTAKVWDATTGACLQTLRGHSDYVRGVALSPDDAFVVTGSCDADVRVWNTGTGECMNVLKGHDVTVAALTVTRDGKTIVSGSWDSTVKLWSWPKGKLKHTLKGHSGKVLAVTNGPEMGAFANTVLSASEDTLVMVWDVSTGECRLRLEGHSSAVNTVVAVPGGQHVVTGSDGGTLGVWDLQEGGAMVRRLPGHAGRIYCVDVSRDGKYLLSGSWDRTAKVWDLAAGECLQMLGDHADRVRGCVLKGSELAVLAVGSKVRTATLNLSFDFQCVAYNKAANPDGFLSNVDQHIDAYSLSFVLPLLVEAAREGRVQNMRGFFQRNPPIAPDFCQLLSAALDSHSEECVRVVVELMVQAVNNTLHGEEGLYWAPDANHGIHVQLLPLVERYPALLELLLTSCPLIPSSGAAVASFSVHEFVGDDDDDPGYMEFCPCDYLDYPAWACLQAKEPTTKVQMRPTKPAPSPTRTRRGSRIWGPMFDDPEDSGSRPISTVEHLVVPFPDLAGSKASGVDFLRELLKTGRANSFSGIIPQVLVEHRWRRFGRRIHLRNTAVYLLTLALFVAMGFIGQDLDGTSVLDLSEGRKTDTKVAAFAVGGCLLAVTVYHTLREVRQFWYEGMALYLRSVWNWLDVLRISMTYVAVVALAADAHSLSRLFFAIGSYLFWFGILFFMQAFSTTGPLVRMVLEIVVGMRWFLLVLGIALLATGNVFVLLNTNSSQQGYVDVADVLLTMFRLLMLSDLELLNFTAGPYTIALKLVWVLTTILVPIVLLNLLIALMSDSYELIQAQAVVEFQRLRAQIIHEQEIYFGEAQFCRADWYPRFLHVLLPRGRNTGGPDKAQWQGVLHALQLQMNTLTAQTNERVQDVEKKVEMLRDEMNDAHEKMGQRLNDIHLLLKHRVRGGTQTGTASVPFH